MTTETQHYAGFDLGGTRLKYGVVDGNGSILSHAEAETPQTIAGLQGIIIKAWQELRDRHGPLRSAGFGLPGLYSRARRMVVQSPHCAILEGFDLEAALARLLDVPFIIDNEANLAAYGEYAAGAGRNTRSLVLVTVGSGVGTGIILEGKIWRGACGFAGELGHVTIRPAGFRCRCGRRGCLETEVSAPRIVKEYVKRAPGRRHLTAADVCREAEGGDPTAVEVFTRAGRALGIGVAAVINLLNPEKILLGGGVMEAGELLLGPARAEAGRHGYRASYACCRIERAALGNRAGFIGAALGARDSLGG